MENLEIKKQLITPSIAKSYLEQNVHNRRISRHLVSRFSKDMMNGRWKEDTAEMIKISKTGTILDGQHRLHAVIKSNRSLYFHVVSNLDDMIFDVLDTGKSRNSSDCFMVAGIKNNSITPSIIAQYNLLKAGYKAGIQTQMKSSNSELLEQYYENAEHWQNITTSTINLYKSFAKILTPSLIGGFYAYFYELRHDKAELFMNQLCTGIDCNNMISLLRTKLMQDKMAQRKIPKTLKMALIIKTWNMFLTGKNAKILKFDTVNEEYPKAIRGNIAFKNIYSEI